MLGGFVDIPVSHFADLLKGLFSRLLSFSREVYRFISLDGDYPLPVCRVPTLMGKRHKTGNSWFWLNKNFFSFLCLRRDFSVACFASMYQFGFFPFICFWPKSNTTNVCLSLLCILFLRVDLNINFDLNINCMHFCIYANAEITFVIFTIFSALVNYLFVDLTHMNTCRH